VQSTANLTQALEESTRRTIGSFDSFLLSVRGMQLAQGEQFDLTAKRLYYRCFS